MNKEESASANQYRRELERVDQYRRLQEFPRAIQELRQTNAAVCHITNLYLHGDILTREEALCQMVVALSKNWQQMAERAFRNYSCLMNATVFDGGKPNEARSEVKP